MPDMPCVVCNTSPLVYLHRIERLELLRSLYGRISVTRQVAAELDAGGMDAPNLQAREWVSFCEARIPEALDLVPDLGAGEASTIALALEIGPSALVILDDRLGRRIAAWRGLRLTGTAGILLRAKERGLIPSVKPLLENLISSGFYLRPRHLADICRLAKE